MSGDNKILKEKRPKASVIVLNYNASRFIEDCLNSLLAQRLQREEFEIIFADNNSTDDSVNVVKKRYPFIRLIQFDKNYGYCEGNNRAVQYAKGKYVAFLNVDTVVHPDWLSEMIKVVEQNPWIQGCHSNQITPWAEEYGKMEMQGKTDFVYYFDLSVFGYVKYYKKPYFGKPFPTLFLSGACMIIVRDIIRDLRYVFDPDFFMYGEDLDLALRINSLGYETVVVPPSIVYHKSSFGVRGQLNLATFRLFNRLILNRFIVFFKNMTWIEFFLFLPFLIAGIPVKLLESRTKLAYKIIYVLISLPLNFFGFLRALFEFHKYKDRRKDVLRKRKKSRFWLNKRILRLNE
jgi:GT2 family glycosyltransferase